MKKLLILSLIGVCGYIAFKKVGGHKKLEEIFEPRMSIEQLKNNPSLYADSLVTLHHVTVQNPHIILNYSKSVITDGTSQVLFLSNRPYNEGEVLECVKGRFIVVFQKENQRCEIFVDENLKPMNDLIQCLAGSVVF